MATYTNPKNGRVHSAGKGDRTLCGMVKDYMQLHSRGKKVTCKRCLKVLES